MLRIFSSEKKKLRRENGELRKEISRRKSEIEELVKIKNYIEEERKSLNERIKQVEERENNIINIINVEYEEREKILEKKIKNIIGNVKDSECDIPIKLNIGGNIYITSKETLTNIENSFFHIMLSEKFNNKPNEKGEYFIDRNGNNFNIILDYLRGEDVKDIVDELSRANKQRLKEDIKYYGLEPMLSIFNLPMIKILQNNAKNRKILKFDCDGAVSFSCQVDIKININLPCQYDYSKEYFYIGLIKDYTNIDIDTLDGYFISNHHCYKSKEKPLLKNGSYMYQDTDFSLKNFNLRKQNNFTITLVYNHPKNTISFHNAHKIAKFYCITNYNIPFVFSMENCTCSINNISII